jgi:hypothetical protein
MINLSKETTSILNRGLIAMMRDAIVQYTTDEVFIGKILDDIMSNNAEPVNIEGMKALVSPLRYSDSELQWLTERLAEYEYPDKIIATQCILEQAKSFDARRKIDTEEYVSGLRVDAA